MANSKSKSKTRTLQLVNKSQPKSGVSYQYACGLLILVDHKTDEVFVMTAYDSDGNSLLESMGTKFKKRK
jgi:ABC-type antimicrobial peptide transport system ATPase subunit